MLIVEIIFNCSFKQTIYSYTADENSFLFLYFFCSLLHLISYLMGCLGRETNFLIEIICYTFFGFFKIKISINYANIFSFSVVKCLSK